MKSWLIRSALASATISLSAWAAGNHEISRKPAIVLVDAADSKQWQAWTQPLGWEVIAPPAAPDAAIDARIDALQAAALDAVKNGEIDGSRLYLAGRGEAAAEVFYGISRAPDVWAAAVAVGGSPQPAVDTGRLYAANFSNVPVLWIGAGEQDKALAAKLAQSGLTLEWHSAAQTSPPMVFEWLAKHVRADYPTSIDCETDSTKFSRCYWIRLMQFDAAERNDVLDSSRIPPAIRPALNLGAYGYKIDDAGPGILISFLPKQYSGPLKIGDRIVALEGRPIAGGRAYQAMMAQFTEERQITALVQRGKERLRLETAVILPKPIQGVTARVQADFDPAAKEIRIVSRVVGKMQVTISPAWTPAVLTWNGVALTKIDRQSTPRCFELTIARELENGAPCPE